ncbi:MAG: hypothetical protein KAH57_00895 [Thermoplasmata archaeon]|nr:hypothetical protein [Thermoplasmata archaeon]
MSGEKIDEGLVKRRRISSMILMIVGIPNFLIAIITSLGGFALAGLLIYIMIELKGSDGGSPLDGLCIAFCLIFLIMAVIALIIVSIIAFFFAHGVGGQAIGGYYGYKGTHFCKASVLSWVGTIFAFLGGIAVILIGISMDGAPAPIRAVLIGLGIYELLSSLISGVATIVMITAKSSFQTEKEENRDKKRKSRNKKKEDKKKREKK